jgi:hypothetical protein
MLEIVGNVRLGKKIRWLWYMVKNQFGKLERLMLVRFKNSAFPALGTKNLCGGKNKKRL